jgi:hypothetical protein
LIATADLRYIGLAPQPATHESRRNPGGFHTAVLDMGWPSETLIGRYPAEGSPSGGS